MARPFFLNPCPKPLVFRLPSIRRTQHVPDTRLYINRNPPTQLASNLLRRPLIKMYSALQINLLALLSLFELRNRTETIFLQIFLNYGPLLVY